jgi:hypothetical protein
VDHRLRLGALANAYGKFEGPRRAAERALAELVADRNAQAGGLCRHGRRVAPVYIVAAKGPGVIDNITDAVAWANQFIARATR